MTKTFLIGIKDLRLVFRDRAALILMLVAPFLLTLGMGLVTGRFSGNTSGSYAQTEELIELCKVAAPYGGSYITHMRSEGNRFLEAIDEVIRIAKESGIHAEIYHLNSSWFYPTTVDKTRYPSRSAHGYFCGCCCDSCGSADV